MDARTLDLEEAFWRTQYRSRPYVTYGGRVDDYLPAYRYGIDASVQFPDRSFADVWTALGGELKPSLDVVVTAPVAGLSFPAAPPVVSPPTLITQGLNGSVPVETRRGGATRVAAERKQHETETSPAGIRRRRRKSEGPTA